MENQKKLVHKAFSEWLSGGFQVPFYHYVIMTLGSEVNLDYWYLECIWLENFGVSHEKNK